MIHRRKGRKLSRTASHRKALLSNLAVSLIMNKKIQTTLAKARELRGYFEALVSKSKKAYSAGTDRKGYSVHLMREVNKYLNDRGAVKMLFEEIAPKVIDRPGGYTRVLKMGRRHGDSAEIALIELVDYNVEKAEVKSKEKAASASDTEKKAKATKKTRTTAKKTAKKTSKRKKTEATD